MEARLREIHKQSEAYVAKKKNQFSFSRLRVSLNVEEEDFPAQISDCENGITRLKEHLHLIRAVNNRVYQEI